MNPIGNMMGNMIRYREPAGDTGHGRMRCYLFRAGVGVAAFLFCYCAIRYGVNVYLAKQAEGKLQTASSYEMIYQSFARVEARQLHIQKKWENHRGRNGAQSVKNHNLSFLMSCSSAASAALGEVRTAAGLGSGSVGQYRQYVAEASGDRGSDTSAAGDKLQDSAEQYDLEGKENLTEEVAKPDQFVVEGEYIYTLWQEGELSYDGGDSHLVIYHAVDGRLDQIYVSPWVMWDGSGTELMVSGDYLYITTNMEEYDDALDELQQKSCATYVYDITDPSHPKRVQVLTQAGEYDSMKMQGGYLYIFSKFQNFSARDPKEADAYIPTVNGKKIPAEDIYIQRDLYGTGYVVMSAYALGSPDGPTLMTAKAVVGTAEVVRVSDHKIYICSNVVPKNSDQIDRTGVTVLAYEHGDIKGTDHLVMRGSIDMTQPVRVNEACLSMHMRIHSYRGSFVEIEDWILPGWEGVPLKIQMGEQPAGTEERLVYVDGAGDRVHEVDVLPSEEMIWDTSFRGQLFAVDEENYIGVGHTGEDKNVKLLWYQFVTEDEPVVQASISLKEYYSLVTGDSRTVYFDPDKRLIGFSTTGSRGMVYYLYQYQQDADAEAVQFQKICEENFGKDIGNPAWIRGTVMPAEDDIFYMIRNGGYEMSGLSLPLPGLEKE